MPKIRRARWLVPVGVAAGSLVLMASGCPPPPQPTLFSAVYNCTGSGQAFVVPAGVTALGVHAYGAQGAANETDDQFGGLGGRAIGVMPVTPGQGVNISVGCQPPPQANTGGFLGGGNGIDEGGGGGGASVVNNGATLFVGGGGGGGGGDDTGQDGGAGGFPAGTAGFGLSGGGGTQTAGGIGGAVAGQDGTAFAGGAGGDTNFGGGGGGGGLYGGGGGDNGGGGGGGSSTGPAGATFENAAQAGHGVVVLLWYA